MLMTLLFTMFENYILTIIEVSSFYLLLQKFNLRESNFAIFFQTSLLKLCLHLKK